MPSGTSGSYRANGRRRHHDSEKRASREEAAQLRAAALSVLPRCHFATPSGQCPKIGVKWVARTCLYCDQHGSPWLQDSPWAELVRTAGC